VDGYDSYKCVCKPGYYGDRCETGLLSCEDINKAGYDETQGTVHVINPFDDDKGLLVQCDQEMDGGGWTLIQRRYDGSENFEKPWHQYVEGFGEISGEFWLGLENIHKLTRKDDSELLIELEDFNGYKKYARYDKFSLGPGGGYKLKLGLYSGDAGDSFSINNGQHFSTFDEDQDPYYGSCSVEWGGGGGWWYGGKGSCHHANLNGIHQQYVYNNTAIRWSGFRGPRSLKGTKMMIRKRKSL